MNKIDSANQPSISWHLLEKILSQYNIGEFTFEEIKDGVENISILIRTKENKFVLRIYRRLKKSYQIIKQELQFQEYLSSQNIPVPNVFSNKDNEKLTLVEIEGMVWQTILMQYMGKTDFKFYTSELITELATIQAKMHEAGSIFAKKQQKHQRLLSELKETIAEKHSIADINDNEILDFLKRGKEFFLSLSPDLPHGYNHLDYDTYGNVLVKDNKVIAVLDFDDLAYSPSVVCLGYSLWHVLLDGNDTDLVNQYLLAYEKIRPLAKEEKAILPQIILFRNYAIGAIELTVRRRHKYIQHIMNLEKVITGLRFND